MVAQLKSGLVRGLYESGALSAALRLARHFEFSSPSRLGLQACPSTKYIILCYHGVGAEGSPVYSTLPADGFKSHMHFIRRHFRVLSLSEMLDELESRERRPHAVIVTFDDGYRSVYQTALPILRRYAIPATIFLTVGAIETGLPAWYDRIFLALRAYRGEELELVLHRPLRMKLASSEDRVEAAERINLYLRGIGDDARQRFCDEFAARIPLAGDELENKMLSWDQVRQMSQEGLSFGSHTWNHAVVSKLSAAEVEHQLVHSKHVLEDRLQYEIRDFAFPFGRPSDCGGAAPALLRQTGYRCACTTVDGYNTAATDRFGLFRFSVSDSVSVGRLGVMMARCLLAGEAAMSGDVGAAQDVGDSQERSRQQLKEVECETLPS